MAHRVRQSLALPITLGALAIVFTVAVLVGWNLVLARYYGLVKGITRQSLGPGYWVLLGVGCLLLMMVIAALGIFLATNIRHIVQARQQRLFIDSVTHELKSPLSSIKLCLETLEKHSMDDSSRRQFLAVMHKDVDRLQRFIEQVLEAGRLEHHNRSLTHDLVDVQTLADRCISLVRQRFNVPTTQFVLQFINNTASNEIITDGVALETILTNLLENAVKYSPSTVHIVLRIAMNRDQIEFHVQDQGMGIPRSQLRRIFDRFYRVPRPEIMGIKGTGLGLYVVAGLVERLGGRIRAESGGDYLGSTFLVVLPVQAEAGAA